MKYPKNLRVTLTAIMCHELYLYLSRNNLPRRAQAALTGVGRAARPGGYPIPDFVMGLASPGAFPCPESSPAYNVQFSKGAGGGHYLAFGTEVCVLCTTILQQLCFTLQYGSVQCMRVYLIVKQRLGVPMCCTSAYKFRGCSVCEITAGLSFMGRW